VLNDDQGFLGRCYFALNRHETYLTRLTTAELTELWGLFERVKSALDLLWSPDHYNYVFLMNVQPHLHGHIIPRYSVEREFESHLYTDGVIGDHYSLDNVYVPNDKILASITSLIGEEMQKRAGAAN
jgi:diadenosine tetraphosphate (Ap4A) HIT family hydrolase